VTVVRRVKNRVGVQPDDRLVAEEAGRVGREMIEAERCSEEQDQDEKKADAERLATLRATT
jgi:hypothetical protein